MAIDGPSSPLETQAVFEQLYGTLSELRSGTHISEIAGALLRRDSQLRKLVGIIEDGDRVVYHNVFSRRLVSMRFDSQGVSDEDCELLWRNVGDPTSWVAHNREELEWVHPRYRWVLSLDEEQTTWAYWL